MQPGSEQRAAPWWLRTTGAVVLVVALLALGQGLWLGLNAVLGLPEASWQALALANVVAFAPPAVLLAVWLRRWAGHGIADLGFRVRRPVLGVVVGVAAALVLFVVSQLAVLAVGPAQAETPDPADPVLPGLGVALVLLVTIAVQASAEELFLRGYLLRTLRRDLGTAAAVAISSVLFGLLHSLNPDATVAYVAATAALGLLLAFIALSGGGLWASCAFHTIWNAIPAIASAGSTSDGPLDTGGAVANLAYVVVYLVFAAVAGLLYRARSSPGTVRSR